MSDLVGTQIVGFSRKYDTDASLPWSAAEVILDIILLIIGIDRKVVDAIRGTSGTRKKLYIYNHIMIMRHYVYVRFFLKR